MKEEPPTTLLHLAALLSFSVVRLTVLATGSSLSGAGD
jgi:hypothetical protein